MALITIDDLKAIRPIYDNMNVDERIDPYIEEAEELFVLPAIGAALYKNISENPDDWLLVLNGGYYKDDTMRISGLKKAVAYLTYSRFIVNQQVSATSFGVDYLKSEYSDRVDMKMLTYQSNQAKETGLSMLGDVVDYLRYSGALSSCRPKAQFPKIKVIG